MQGQEYERQAQKLIVNVKDLFAEAVDKVAKLELIDGVEKLGLDSHFDVEIKEALDIISSTKNKNPSPKEDLYTIALCFRLLRQHGYEVSQGKITLALKKKNPVILIQVHLQLYFAFKSSSSYGIQICLEASWMKKPVCSRKAHAQILKKCLNFWRPHTWL